MRLVSRLVVVLLFASAVLHAQFNGPADTARDTVNAPHAITTDPAILFPAAHDAVLRTGDALKVTLYGYADYSAVGRIDEEGYFILPLVEPVKLADQTTREATRTIAQQLEAAGMFRSPQVQLDVTESPKSTIVVVGETHGAVSGIGGSRRLFDVIAQAGGLAATTSHLVSIDRPGVPDAINVDLGTDPERSRFANVPVFPGDTISTSRIGNFYLLGAFKAQGAFPLTNTAPLTMMQMLAGSGGKLWEAKTEQIHLIRTVGTTRTVTIVDLKRVIEGKDPDPVIQADDIVFAPSNEFKAAIRSGGITTALGIALTLFAVTRY